MNTRKYSVFARCHSHEFDIEFVRAGIVHTEDEASARAECIADIRRLHGKNVTIYSVAVKEIPQDSVE